uniref:Uncharacterized protein n=1 Tax=Anguilla anguilla TaxID=7936 RepID=A0A0E9PIB6_ANGAN
MGLFSLSPVSGTVGGAQHTLASSPLMLQQVQVTGWPGASTLHSLC